MIAYIEGVVHRRDDHRLVIVVQGVGYEVRAPSHVLERANADEHIALHTYHHVREDISDLYGFLHHEEREFFIKLLQVNGVGPRLALAAMSAFPLDELKRAIVHGDAATLQTIPGVGRKTAERIALDLKESIDILPSATTTAHEHATLATALDALVSLGYSRNEALAALRQIDTHLPLEEQVREALKRVNARP